MLLDIEHRLRFAYDGYISESSMELRVEPRSSPQQTVHSFYLAVGPPAKVFRYVDWNRNLVHHFSIADYHDRIEVISRSLVETAAAPRAMEELTDPLPIAGAEGPLRDFVVFGGPVLRSPRLERLARELPVEPGAPLGAQVAGIGAFVFDRLRYVQDVTDYQSTSDDVLEHGSGVCQDFAHVMLALLRLRGIPCRYVGGYLHVPQEAGAPPSQSHAWVEVMSPACGWVAYDPTHQSVPGEEYVAVAHGRHYDDVPPNRGIYRGAAAEALQAGVRSEVSSRTGLLGLREEIGEIDLPVHFRVPVETPAGVTPDQASDEQQQQQ